MRRRWCWPSLNSNQLVKQKKSIAGFLRKSVIEVVQAGKRIVLKFMKVVLTQKGSKKFVHQMVVSVDEIFFNYFSFNVGIAQSRAIPNDWRY